MVYEQSFTNASQSLNINLAHLNSGLYLIRLQTENGEVYSEKVWKE